MGTGRVHDAEMGWVDASSEGATCCDVEISEMTGAEAGKRGGRRTQACLALETGAGSQTGRSRRLPRAGRGRPSDAEGHRRQW
jgi:hypothetical protein